jgi:hypothetical protein
MPSGLKVSLGADWNEWAELRSRIVARDHAALKATLALCRLLRLGSLPRAVQTTGELVVLLDFDGVPVPARQKSQEARARRRACGSMRSARAAVGSGFLSSSFRDVAASELISVVWRLRHCTT